LANTLSGASGTGKTLTVGMRVRISGRSSKSINIYIECVAKMTGKPLLKIRYVKLEPPLPIQAVD